jgi:hypothetical protein
MQRFSRNQGNPKACVAETNVRCQSIGSAYGIFGTLIRRVNLAARRTVDAKAADAELQSRTLQTELSCRAVRAGKYPIRLFEDRKYVLALHLFERRGTILFAILDSAILDSAIFG